MKTPSMAPQVTGTPFIESAPSKDRRNLGVSLRGGRHLVSGDTASFGRAPIDTPEVAEIAVRAPATLRPAEDFFDRWNEALRS